MGQDTSSEDSELKHSAREKTVTLIKTLNGSVLYDWGKKMKKLTVNGFRVKNYLKLYTLLNTETGSTSLTNRCNTTSVVTVLSCQSIKVGAPRLLLLEFLSTC